MNTNIKYITHFKFCYSLTRLLYTWSIPSLKSYSNHYSVCTILIFLIWIYNLDHPKLLNGSLILQIWYYNGLSRSCMCTYKTNQCNVSKLEIIDLLHISPVLISILIDYYNDNIYWDSVMIRLKEEYKHDKNRKSFSEIDLLYCIYILW